MSEAAWIIVGQFALIVLVVAVLAARAGIRRYRASVPPVATLESGTSHLRVDGK